jgi:hypothetical protein
MALAWLEEVSASNDDVFAFNTCHGSPTLRTPDWRVVGEE